MPYQPQTRDTFYKGRQAYNPSIQAYKEAKEQDVEDAKFMKDMEATGKDYRTALIAWDKNAKALDDEAVNFWKQVSPTMTKLVGETMPKALMMKEEADVNKAQEVWRGYDAEKKAQIRKEAEDFVKQKIATEDQRLSIAERADKYGFSEYATYVRGQNKNQVTWLHLKLLREKLPDFERQVSDEVAKAGLDPNDFVGRRGIIDEVKKKFYPTINIQGVRNDILNSQIYKDVDGMGEKYLARQQLIVRKNESEARVQTAKEELKSGLHFWDPNAEDGDAGNVRVLGANFLRSVEVEATVQENPNASNISVSTLFSTLAEFEKEAIEGGMESDDDRNKVRMLLNGEGRFPVLVPHSGQGGKLVPISQLKGENLSYRAYLNSTARKNQQLPISGINGNNNQINNDPDIGTKDATEKAFGWTTSYGEDKKTVINEGILDKWNKEPPTKEDHEKVIVRAEQAVQNGELHPSTLLEIRNWEDGRQGPSESKSIIERHIATKQGSGPLYVQRDEPWLQLLDKDTLQKEYIAKGKIKVVDTVADDATVDTAMESLISEVGTDNYRNEYLIQELNAEVKNRLHARMYPGTDLDGTKGTPPEDFDVDSNVAEIVKELKQEVRDGRDDPSSPYYKKDGILVNQTAWQDNWFDRGKNKRERDKLASELALRKLGPNNDYVNTTIYNTEQLEGLSETVGDRTYFSSDFIKSSLKLGVNPYDLYNAQAARQKPPLKPAQKPDNVKFWGNLSAGELQTLGKLLETGEGTYNYNRLNKAAARIIDHKIKQASDGDDSRRYRPNERKLLQTLGTGNVTDSDTENDRHGKYGMPKADIERHLKDDRIPKELRGIPLADFLKPENANLQQKVAILHMQELTNNAYGDGKTRERNRFGAKVPTITGKGFRWKSHDKAPGPVVREILSAWRGETYTPGQPNPQNTLDMIQYNTLIRGGSL